MFLKKVCLSTALVTSLVSLTANAGTNSQAITLNGTISAVTCEVSLNAGQTVLDVGTFPSASFISSYTQNGKTPLNVYLTGCDKESTANAGQLYIQGETPTVGSYNKLFIGPNNQDVGFMITDADDKQVVNNTPIALDVTVGDNQSYQLTVGMGSIAANPTNGFYSAPIVIAYVSD